MSKITVPVETELVEVTAWPDEVTVSVSAIGGNLTTAQAREFAGLLTEAADKSERLVWVEIDATGALEAVDPDEGAEVTA